MTSSLFRPRNPLSRRATLLRPQPNTSLSDDCSLVLDCLGAPRLPPLTFPAETRMDEKQLAKLVRQNAAKAAKVAKARKGRAYDPTLQPTDDEEDVAVERERFFKEMKRREF